MKTLTFFSKLWCRSNHLNPLDIILDFRKFDFKTSATKWPQSYSKIHINSFERVLFSLAYSFWKSNVCANGEVTASGKALKQMSFKYFFLAWDNNPNKI